MSHPHVWISFHQTERVQKLTSQRWDENFTLRMTDLHLQ